MFNPTDQQRNILNCNENCVVIAGPGSGKTTTIAYKINEVASQLSWYQGIAAISYTNKASNELKEKTKSLCDDLKNSFFGTIDSFYIGNIIIPFGKRFFGLPEKIVVVEKLNSSNDDYIKKVIDSINTVLEKYREVPLKEIEAQNIKPLYEINNGYLKFISSKFKEGIFDLRLVGGISNLIFLSSRSCRNYFLSRYKYLFIDEFQDSGRDQYYLFLRIAEIGVKSWAIGDVNQSIFRFANKSSDYLKDLLKRKSFNHFPMNINHRCHQSIDLYGRKLLGYSEQPTSDENRVYKICVNGTECDIGGWFESELEEIKSRFQISNNSSIGILARKDITLKKFLERINIPHKLFNKTILDEDQSLCGKLLEKILHLSFNEKQTIYNFIDDYFDREYGLHRTVIKKASKLLNIFRTKLIDYKSGRINDTQCILDVFKELTVYIYPHADNQNALVNLHYILKNKEQLDDFIPAKENEIQLMNLHKSKGLEFEVVVHLDLYQFILPEYDWIVKGDVNVYNDSLNLHYVGVTRARKSLFLTTSTKRFQISSGAFINAQQSEFLSGEMEAFHEHWS
ncbi:UvrD-helicase domain-containing protein [Bacillus infantis]|uniref:UvrD-helicase domain-containing protein n=1 Tax=Bacillus infantis TaxID=324767 RepID=UPI003CF1ED38